MLYGRAFGFPGAAPIHRFNVGMILKKSHLTFLTPPRSLPLQPPAAHIQILNSHFSGNGVAEVLNRGSVEAKDRWSRVHDSPGRQTGICARVARTRERANGTWVRRTGNPPWHGEKHRRGVPGRVMEPKLKICERVNGDSGRGLKLYLKALLGVHPTWKNGGNGQFCEGGIKQMGLGLPSASGWLSPAHTFNARTFLYVFFYNYISHVCIYWSL